MIALMGLTFEEEFKKVVSFMELILNSYGLSNKELLLCFVIDANATLILLLRYLIMLKTIQTLRSISCCLSSFIRCILVSILLLRHTYLLESWI